MYNAAEHWDAHKRFTAVFGELKKEYDNRGHRIGILRNLARFLSAWLRDHIREQDQPFVDYFQRFGPLP